MAASRALTVLAVSGTATAFVPPAAPGADGGMDAKSIAQTQHAASPQQPQQSSRSANIAAGMSLGLAAAVVQSGRRAGRKVPSTVRFAEPVSTAAAAAAAAKAAAASTGAAKVGAAVTGAAGSGSLAQGEDNAAATKGGGKPFDPATEVGVTEPLGYFDPAGFCTDESKFRALRAAEIKHGRVAMMAAVGAVVQHFVKLPGFDKVPTGLAAVSVPPGSYGMIALFLVSGGLELALWTESPEKEPGNFGDPAGLGQYTEEMRNRELNNGRMAMFAAIGIIGAELLTGKDGIEQLGF